MGQYKVPQNVEAEDKIIGPLTLKQFIYAVIGVLSGLVSFLLLRKEPVVMLIVGLPPTALFLLLGLYQRQDQPFEALFLSLVSFMVKPRQRLWIKEPIEEVFKIEAPKVVKAVTQRDPREVRGQLEQLSQVVDTRGWGNKKAELQEPSDQPTLESEGRLVAPALPDVGEPIETDVSLADDILDVDNNASAHNIGTLIQDQAQHIRQEAMEKLHAATRKTEGSPQQPVAGATPAQSTKAPSADDITPVGSSDLTTDYVPLPGTTYSPAARPVATNVVAAEAASQTVAAAEILNHGQSSVSTSDMTANPSDGILKLAMENDDRTVSQVAAQANRNSAVGGLAEGQSVSLRNNGRS